MVVIGRWSHSFAPQDTGDSIGLIDVEDDDRQPVGLAQPERVGVHDRVSIDDRVLERQFGEELRVAVDLGVLGVDSIDIGGLEEDLGVHLERPEHRGGIGREEGIAGATGKDHQSALFEMPLGPAADVRFRQRLHADSGHYPGVDPRLLQNVLHGQRVDHRGQHAHVVGVDSVQTGLAGGGPPDDVPATDDQAKVHAHAVHFFDLLREFVDDLIIQADPLLPGKGLA